MENKVRKAKFVLNTMVANESHCIQRMIESVAPHIDYWVIQDNGSTDGTQQMIREFFASKGIPGVLYETEWTGIPGKNRDHALQKCLQTDHGCDWILRVDADEAIEVDDGFDWSLFDDKSVQSFNMLAKQFSCNYYRTWIWNASLPWRFKHDKRHECIYLESCGEQVQRQPLDERYHHRVFGDGKTWTNPYKFMIDALELERDLLVKDELHTDRYHLVYTAKSYRDYCMHPSSKFPLGPDYRIEAARRGIYLFNKVVDLHMQNKPQHMDENGYMMHVFLGELHMAAGDVASAEAAFIEAESYCPVRSEHLLKLACIYRDRGDRSRFFEATTKMMAGKNPFPRFTLFIDSCCYPDTGDQVSELHRLACSLNNVDFAA